MLFKRIIVKQKICVDFYKIVEFCFLFLCLQQNFKSKKNNQSIEKRKKMGCQPSRQQNDQLISFETSQQFKLSYRELVCQDRGQVFDLYHFSSIISRSNYSIVRKVVSRGSQQSRVCKIIPLGNKEYFSALSEVQFLKKLDHPNIVQIIEYFLEPEYLYIIFQEVPGNKILTELNQIKKGVVFQDVVQIMKQIISALDFCHRKQIAHRAITTDNVMLIWKDKKPIVKVLDFSQAIVIGCPTPNPIFSQKRAIILPQAQYQDSQKLDVFDCGYLFYSMILGKKPHRVQINEIIPNCLQIIQEIGLQKQIQSDLKYLMRDMLSIDNFRRPQFSDILKYDIFKYFNKKIQTKQALSNLLQFKSDNNLRYLLSMYGSLNMTSAIQKSEYIMQFYNLDKNKDGQIQLQQMIEGIMNTFNMDRQKAEKHAEKLFQNLDKNKSGSLNFSEFVTGTMKLSKLFTNQFLKAMFNQMDINKDGHISQKQLNNLISGIDKIQILEGKKQVSFQQFKSIMIKMLKQQPKASNYKPKDI